MNDNYILVKHFLDETTISNLLENIYTKNETESKVGTRVNKKKNKERCIFITNRK